MTMENQNNTPATTTTPPAATITPEQMHPPISAPAATETPAASVSTPPEKKVLFKSGDLEFTDAEELAAYTKNLEDQAVRARLQEAARQGLNPTLAQTVNPPPAKKNLEEEVEELLFTDTKQAINRLRQGITEEIKQEDLRKEKQKAFWNGFYGKNPDLKDKERIVNLIVMERGAEIGAMTPAKAEEFLAKETRELAMMAKRSAGERVETLPSGGAVVTSSGGAHTPAVNNTPKAPLSFVDQVKSLRKRRK